MELRTACLTNSRGEAATLLGVSVEGTINDLLSEVSITQTYCNHEKGNIEAVYTFPLPMDAVLLNLTVQIGSRQLQGTVVEKKKAETAYEDAIVDGDTAIMLEMVETGTYAMNVGNIMAGEQVKISFTYGLFHKWQGDTLRFFLPTTIAPRYGNPLAGDRKPHQVPEANITTDNRFTLNLKVLGSLAMEALDCPSHQITVQQCQSETGRYQLITFASRDAAMDRDFILNIMQRSSAEGKALWQMDCGEYLLCASFHPQFDIADDTTPRNIKIVIDCSGSMAGDSIAQAKAALHKILDGLRPQDYFNIIAFGNYTDHLFHEQQQVQQKSLSQARAFADKLDANMGGTEIGKALSEAFSSSCPAEIRPDVLLITDGEITDIQPVIDAAVASEHRVFTVGVGSSVAEAFVRKLAEKTSGSCELVSPNEKMAEKVYRHFRRIYEPRSLSMQIIWPDGLLRTYPDKTRIVYNGDTLTCFGWYQHAPQGTATLSLKLSDGRSFTQQAQVAAYNQPHQAGYSDIPGIFPRMVAAQRLSDMKLSNPEGKQLALKYQLISKRTNYLVIHNRPETQQAQDLPELRIVKQNLAAGWGGVGSAYDLLTFCRKSAASVTEPVGRISYCKNIAGWSDSMDVQKSPALEKDAIPSTIQDLANLFVPDSDIQALYALKNAGYSEESIVVTYLYLMIEKGLQTDFERDMVRKIKKAFKAYKNDSQLYQEIENIINSNVAVRRSLMDKFRNILRPKESENIPF